MRVMLSVAYDGTGYCGSQIQDNAVTIESVLNTALSDLFGQDIKVNGASRTDSGVHALMNLFVFDADFSMPPEKIFLALNTRLPADIRVNSSVEVPDGFHPRFAKTEKVYRYRILNRMTDDPLRTRYTWHVYGKLDVEAMNEAAAFLTGEHDFTSFASEKAEVKSFVRTILSAEVLREDDEVLITVTGNGFLYNMVRIITGTLVETGLGRRTPSSVREALDAKDRTLAGPTAPAKGLTLMEVRIKDAEDTQE